MAEKLMLGNQATPRRLPTLGFLHTTPATIGMAENFMKRLLPGCGLLHFLDGAVKLANFAAPIGETPRENLLRWAKAAEGMERAGCELIVSCCSLMERATEYARKVVSVPMLQLDACILDRAVAEFGKIGVITTSPYTVPHVESGLRERAAQAGKKIELLFGGDSEALALFNAGESEKHDARVLRAVRELMEEDVDCILMGQIPFALMEGKLEALNPKKPVLCAGKAAFQHLAGFLEASSPATRPM